ncbi:hypothetical protein EHF33_20855 (plasmid) [Deinococcus psychrotolerans]|uniref:Bacteriophage T5 Orf172 DNA-binding domain-containing protein n=1 Tax=Deinococcus psychrotolerans TaxID=2489213 RepID=A0A3G8YK95_9DEIO|nr:GIY-YIG nuclease family protein [Deinococcus psychrotolerans]AZI45363.1 hypothetical protein EHF33_20855 [Deinococcus psychrotolerans]
MASGYLYALANESMPGVFKVGCTSRNPFDRAKELRTTGVPTAFHVVAAVLVADIKTAEASAHTLLGKNGQRIDDEREFFSANLAHIVLVFSQILNETGEAKPYDETPVSHEQILKDANTYHFGEGTIPPDLKKALKLYDQALQLGSHEAAFALSKIYREGQGIRKSTEKASYYTKRGRELRRMESETSDWPLWYWLSTLSEKEQHDNDNGDYYSPLIKAGSQGRIDILDLILPRVLKQDRHKEHKFDLFLSVGAVAFKAEDEKGANDIIIWIAENLKTHNISISRAPYFVVKWINGLMLSTSQYATILNQNRGNRMDDFIRKIFIIRRLDTDGKIKLPYDLLSRLRLNHIDRMKYISSPNLLIQALEDCFA